MTITVMTVLMAIPNLISIIMDLMKTVELEMGSGTGADKKAAVLSGVAAVVGDATVWTKVQAVFAGIIDILAKFHFGSKA